ncbi:MAG: hypothetical protein ACREC6_01920, partial [Hyphomicrobiaceae bacterium]
MTNRRAVLAGGACALSAPYFFFTSTVRADKLTDKSGFPIVTGNFGMRPVGHLTGTDIVVEGGGTILGRRIRAQA